MLAEQLSDPDDMGDDAEEKALRAARDRDRKRNPLIGAPLLVGDPAAQSASEFLEPKLGWQFHRAMLLMLVAFRSLELGGGSVSSDHLLICLLTSAVQHSLDYRIVYVDLSSCRVKCASCI